MSEIPRSQKGSLSGLTAIPNVRDLSGASELVKPGLLFRSAEVKHASPEDVALLAQTVNTIIDLRDPVEWKDEDADSEENGASNLRKTFPPVSPDHIGSGKRTVRHPLLNRRSLGLRLLSELPLLEKLKVVGYYMSYFYRTSAQEIMVSRVRELPLYEFYFIALTTAQKNICSVLDLLSKPSVHPVLFHCTHGKDRTGIIAALSLHILGVSRDRICEDYSKSHANLPQRLLDEAFEKHGFPPHWQESPAEAIGKALELVEEKHGSLDAYLDSIGFEEEKRIRFRSVFCQDAK